MYLIRIILMSFICFACMSNAYTQDYHHVEDVVSGYPVSFSSPEKLAKRIEKDFSLPEEKARALFSWISHHIIYDVKAISRGHNVISYSYATEEEKARKESQIQQDLALKTLHRKKAICHGYATLYKLVCDQLGLECVIIAGTGKIYESEIGKRPGTPNHSWNAVKIDNKWNLVDATWGAGYIDGTTQRYVAEYDDVYFFTPPGLFALNHYPVDSRWLFVSITPQQFASLPLYYAAALRSGIRIEQPDKGIITLSGKNSVKLILSHYNKETLNLSLNGRSYPQPIIPQQKGNQTIFTIHINRPGLMTLYVNGDAFTGYKLVRK